MTKQEREAILDESRAGVLVIVLAIVGAIYMLNGLEPIRYGDPSVDTSVSTVPVSPCHGDQRRFIGSAALLR